MDTRTQTHVGIVGCGLISSIYLEAPRTFPNLHIAACADIDLERARSQAARYNIPKACSVDELLADPEIDVILNLTIPKAHAEVSLAALAAGKSIYSEKPLAITRDLGKTLMETANTQHLFVGCAPDTFLGGGIQTCVQLINEGAIGTPVAATAFMLGSGPESWHPDPDFYYQPGAGPLFDMGPYYLTALIALLGPIQRVTGSARISRAERTITSQPKYGTQIQVNTPTHVASVLDFVSGPIATLVTSFDTLHHNTPRLEIYGTEGTLSVPDPNTFGGPVSLRRAQESEWHEVSLTHGYTTNSRGIGLADMVYAMQQQRPHRASGALAYHVLDTMEAIYDSSQSGRHIQLSSQCQRPAPMPAGDWQGE